MLRSKSRCVLVTLVAMLALGALTATSALASGAPSVETKPATEITETKVTFHGAVNPSGAETKYYWEFGPTTSYGTKTSEASAGSGTVSVEVSKGRQGFTPATTYHYRIVATNANGTSFGADSKFTTSGYAPGLPEFAGTFPTETEYNLGKKIGFEFDGAKQIDCETGSGRGELVSPTEGTATLTFTGCEFEVREAACKTEGANAGEIRSEKLRIRPVYLSKATKEVALRYQGQTDFIGRINCGEYGFYGPVTGSVLSRFTGINKKVRAGSAEFKENYSENTPSNYEGGAGEKLTALLSLVSPESKFGLLTPYSSYFEANHEFEMKA